MEFIQINTVQFFLHYTISLTSYQQKTYVIAEKREITGGGAQVKVVVSNFVRRQGGGRSLTAQVKRG